MHYVFFCLLSLSRYIYLVPPKWTVEPRDINVSAGHSIALHCQAEGYPTPSILWKRAMGNNNKNRKEERRKKKEKEESKP